MKQLLDSLPSTLHTDSFKDIHEHITDGYLRYLSHKAKYEDHKPEIIYQRYSKLFKNEEDKAFQMLYEFVNIRTYSEAICETIGSMMAISVSNGRNLQPINLRKEVFLRFNLPPIHHLEKFTSELAKQWRVNKTNMYRKGKKRSGLKLDEISSTIENYRKRREEKSYTPVDFLSQ